jgi:undecaprenyl phosphate N,N'-diacetylbacillosamine 1-phosphate transferase
MYQKYFKRFLDIILSIILIITLFPIFAIIFFLVWIYIGYPIFTQKRPGLNNKVFNIYKFKTLYDSQKKVPERLRRSSFGDFLRRTGLDELPQLFNVLENKMSLVGPRPLLVEYLKKYSSHEKKRHFAKPGITGLAQINSNSFKRKVWKKSLNLDIFYVTNVNFLLDIKILYKTIILVVLRKKQYKDFKKFYE